MKQLVMVAPANRLSGETAAPGPSVARRDSRRTQSSWLVSSAKTRIPTRSKIC